MEKTLSEKFCPVSGTNLLLRGENCCGRAFSTSIKFQDLGFKGKKGETIFTKIVWSGRAVRSSLLIDRGQEIITIGTQNSAGWNLPRACSCPDGCFSTEYWLTVKSSALTGAETHIGSNYSGSISPFVPFEMNLVIHPQHTEVLCSISHLETNKIGCQTVFWASLVGIFLQWLAVSG